MGDKAAETILNYFATPSLRSEVEALLEVRVEPQAVKVTHRTDHPISGKSFVLTVTLQNYTRQGAGELIKERGGKASSSVSSKTGYVVAGNEPGSKYDQAVKLGVKILEI